MRLADCSVPKMTPDCGTRDGQSDGLTFCSVEDGVRSFLSAHAAGKALFVADGGSYPMFAPVTAPRAVFAVLDSSDALPLFAMPDEVSCVLAAGGADTLVAARVFAAVRGCACALFPTEATLDGALCRSTEVNIGGVRGQTELAPAEVYCDLARMKSGLARAYCRLLLTRLALVEERAVSVLRRRARGENFENVYGMLLELDHSPKSLVSLNARVRRAESDGFPAGEGVTLARLTGGNLPEWRAFRVLLALYRTFFRKGKARRYFVPDYAARCALAGAEYGAQEIPTAAEYAHRALALEKFRAEFVRETDAVVRGREGYLRTLRALAGSYFDETGVCPLKILPEKVPDGLSAIIRDFGLMEEL